MDFIPGALDDGRGRARVGLFRHKHELETGRTSSVGMEVSRAIPNLHRDLTDSDYQILGFGPSGAPILPHTAHSADPDVIRREKMGWEEISIQAAKIVSFIGKCRFPVRLAFSSLFCQIWPDMSDI
jgi:hypothetical protein